MPETKDHIIKRIKSIRKSKRRSIHDCARILGVSKENYHSIEKGTMLISLPEMELLAIYLGENPSDILSGDHKSPSNAVFLKDEIRPQFLKIRGKMLRALITLARENRSVTLEDIQQATHIPLETLEAYDQGVSPMPIEDLVKVCTYLEIPIDSLHDPIWPNESKLQEDHPNADWEPEYETVAPLNDLEIEDPYTDILKALQKVPKQDQAYIAKYLLEKLRSM